MEKINVTIWHEYVHEHHDEEVANLYPGGMHKVLQKNLAAEDFNIRTATLDEPEHGLTDEVLANTDVMTWWGHGAHHLVEDRIVDKVVRRVRDGMGFIALHSAHASKPFGKLMGTDCSLRWRGWKEHARVWTVKPSHPIAQGVPDNFKLEAEEMYGEFFSIPQPDDIVFITWFAGGDVFRGGCTFTRDLGKIFYFHPGHENCPSYYDENVLKVISNAIRWAKPEANTLQNKGASREPFEPIENLNKKLFFQDKVK